MARVYCFCYRFVKQLLFFVLLFGIVENGVAQDKDKVRDSTSTTFSFAGMSLPNPDSIEEKYEYDPTTDRYIYREKIGEVNITYPLIVTPEEFQDLVLKEQMKKYFKEKADALDGKKEGSEEAQRNLLPNFYVNSNFFESIFGGRDIEIIPQGSVEIDLGMLYTKQDNPSLSPRNQRNFTFDFDQRISMSLLGKIGTRLQITANYDTEATFAFQEQFKLEYTPTEDDIIRSLELGNVSMPLNSALIQGAQSLFGVKAQLQFGKTTITGVYATQQSESRSVNIEGGGSIENFEIFASDYDENRHFFLAHYFRDTYDKSLERYPFINSNVQITRLQVWVTSRTNNTQTISDARNVVGIQDLGESNPSNIGVYSTGNIPASFNKQSDPNAFPDNKNNAFNPLAIGRGGLLTNAIRDISRTQEGFGTLATGTNAVEEGFDYVRLENARQLSQGEYSFHPQLGYLSLNQRLNNDEVLAVAFQYTVGGRVFQVGEFANDGIDTTQGSGNTSNTENTDEGVSANQNLVVKMLKSTITDVQQPVWDLMMKNIYNLGAFRLEQSDFRFNIFYTNPSPVNFIKEAPGTITQPSTALPSDVDETTLLRVFNMDRLNANNDPVVSINDRSGTKKEEEGDGFFDYVPGLTVDTENGRIIFTSVEPFGSYLFGKLEKTPTTENYTEPATYNANQAQYVFRDLYTTTKIQAQQNAQEKDKFQLKGRYKNSGQDGISIGAFNVPRGSVTVTAGGRVLQEGVDYTVNYQLGRVNILDEALKASNTPIQVSTENNAVFGQQVKRFSGINVEHKFTEDFMVGGTFINLNERPLTQKSNLSFEPINNTIVGLNASYATEVPFLTRMVNKLPNIETEAPSNFSIRGELAYLIAGAPKGADFNGKVTSYIDDFEAAQASIQVGNALSWELSSIPKGFDNNPNNLPSAQQGLSNSYKRAKLSWYTIDPIFYTNQRPDGITDESISDYKTRRIFVNEIFPETDIQQGQPTGLTSLDLVYDPTIRGPYNYNPEVADNGSFNRAEDNFGGIMRSLTTTNFEQSNIEFIEFWMLDPFIYEENATNPGGKIVFNLGNISEDVFPDGRKQYENGLPADINSNEGVTITGLQSRVPENQSLVYAFATEGEERRNQDVGYDGLDDAREVAAYGTGFGQEDPSADNYENYLARDGNDILDRYSLFNGIDGNSPSELTNETRGNETIPTAEDVNRDNTMNTIDNYFVYEVDIRRGLTANDRYVNDVREISVPLRNGEELQTRWIQFKIPVYEPLTEQLRTDGGNNPPDFRSIRFMRMLMTGFSQKTVLRMGTLDLVRGDYRRYVNANADGINEQNITADGRDQTEFIVSTISKENNGGYVEPPGVFREELQNNNSIIREDEASLDLTVLDLQQNDARAVFKNFNIDMRQYENFELFLHAEDAAQGAGGLADDDLVALIRMGNDFTENFYQIEIPLKVSPQITRETQNSSIVWPEENSVNVPLSLLKKIKSGLINSKGAVSYVGQPSDILWFDEEGNIIPVADGTLGPVGSRAFRVAIKGNPSVGNVRVMMLGIKNNSTSAKSGRVWFNEMRMSDLKNQGGWAAVANMDANLADFASVSATGRRSTVGFGGIEQGPNQRSREDIAQYDMVTSMNVGQLLPKKWGIQVPVNYSRGEELITPQFDPLNEDLELEGVLELAQDQATKDAIEERSTEYTRRQSVSVIGLRKERSGTGDRKPMPYDVENFTFSSTYNQTDHRDFEIEKSLDQSVNLGGTYDFNFQPLSIEPLKKVKFLDKSKYFKLLQDFNFNLLPTSITTNANFNRQYNEQTFRDIDTQGSNNIGLDPLYQRNFLFDWQYGITYDLTKSFNLNFTSSNNRIVRNYIDEETNITDNTIGIWDDFLNVGTPNLHNQSLQANYEIPFSKVPVLKFLKGTYSYSTDFQWQKGSEALKTLDDIPDLGNTIQNSNVHRVSGNVDMDKLYKYVGLVKKRNNSKRVKKKKKSKDSTAAKGPKIAPRSKKTNTRISKNLSPANKAYNTFVGLLTAIKKVNVNYQQDNGIFLPGYTPDIGFVGTLRPTAGFTFGSQAEVRNLAARNGWLTLYQDFNQQYTEVEGRQLDMQVTVDVLKDLKIDVSMNRNYSETYAENFRVRPSDLAYESLAPNTFGNFSISSLLIKTAFSSRSENSSAAFDTFKQNRAVIARRLAAEDPNSVGENEGGFPVGYGSNNQAVLLPAFLAAYSGTSAEKVSTNAFKDTPLPNWDIKYTGFMKVKWFKKKFKRFSLAHGYRSTYTINQFQTNLEFDRRDRSLTDQNGNFRNELLFSNVNLIEQFSPLFKLDMETKSSVKVSAEMKKDRALSFSFDNNLLTEIFGNEYVVGLGYRLKDLALPLRVGGKRRIVKSDLNFKMDLSLRENQTVIRYIDLDDSEVTAGQSIYGLNFTVDYSLSKNLTALFFYDHTFSTFAISTAFPQTTIRGGFTLRYNFGN